ncbi:MAG: GntR family transcriptional regulator [Boseongicola sp. SB0673_bin_14]|nr:GntR family transcriptional regulator [Boseongicola sp.]MXW85551.1 GntR family transcriptional regulator [Boseongicola sp. SB0667_bin_21]MYI70598.1 GntR family transcriptional regulator [Boseongicola sp. SB0673_bin_14]
MQARPSEPPIAAHERVYRTLRSRIMHGEMVPGTSLTLRGIGQEFGTSMTPAREAARRLVAEGALTMSVSGRISTPELANDRIEELASLRGLLETELAVRALPRAHLALIERLTAINSTVAEAVRRGDAVAYIRTNLEFHRTLYLRAQAPAMLALVETVWLQLGPTMRKLYGRMRQGRPPDSHRLILAALRNREEAALRVAVRTDVTKGLRLLMT